MGRSREVVVVVRHEPDEETCVEALELLLTPLQKSKAARDKAAENAAMKKGLEDEQHRDAERSIPKA
jgi:hypothetical protein